MTATDITTTTDHLPVETRDAIAELFLQGRRVSEVIAQGLNRRGGWRRSDVIDVVSARGWKLDSDGRIPARFRATAVLPVGTVPGAPAPVPVRAAPWPEKGTVTPDRADDGTGQLLADGKAHSVTRVRRLAEKAEDTLGELRRALKREEGREAVRRRLAELDAERDRLRAQLGGPGRPKKTTTTVRPTAPAAAAKPIDHGTWGGWQAEKKRGLDHCEPCETAKNEQMAKMRGKKETDQ